MDMTYQEIRAKVMGIQAMAEKATPGPWGHGVELLPDGTKEPWVESEYDSHQYYDEHGFGMEPIICCEGGSIQENNAEFIAHARADVPWLCEQVMKLLPSPGLGG